MDNRQRNRQPSQAALERLAQMRAEYARQANLFRNSVNDPNKFLSELENVLNDERSVISFSEQDNKHIIKFNHFTCLYFQRYYRKHLCGLQENTADGPGAIESLAVDDATLQRAFDIIETWSKIQRAFKSAQEKLIEQNNLNQSDVQMTKLQIELNRGMV